MNQATPNDPANAFINRAAAPSIEEATRALARATATTYEAMGRFLAGALTETQLEVVLRAEAEARFVHFIVTKLPELEGTIQQMMAMARQKFKETQPLRDSRPYVRARG